MLTGVGEYKEEKMLWERQRSQPGRVWHKQQAPLLEYTPLHCAVAFSSQLNAQVISRLLDKICPSWCSLVLEPQLLLWSKPDFHPIW